ncbi:ATP-dependent helicase [Lentibacillus sediminis]|uniref:ATP-dependent helicase n=1 Tax=Lentibacillus sediminis TaxID=1940529 RepID=UPI001304032C|nr:ATP-dependent helicase [Lentibacillus sediminis]
MNKILLELNQEQRNAVVFNGKFLEIIAGPGTGKTKTLAAKILYTQSELGIDIDKILGISFSRSAKSQLINKLDEFSDIIGYGGMPAVLTFHSLAHRILKYGVHHGESRFRNGIKIMETEDFINLDPSLTKGLCNDYANRIAVNKALSAAYNQIRQGSRLENHPLHNYNEINNNSVYSVTTYEQGRILVKGNELKTFWTKINRLEKVKNITDYQGLITEAIRLLQLKQKTYNEIAENYTHIFIDEYQDTSLAQEELLLSLINEAHHITIVGDPNQTIYTFNGSNSLNMKRFADYFSNKSPSDFSKVELIHNYRSTSEVVALANDFIKESNIVSYNARTGFKPAVVETHSIDLATNYIAEEIIELTKNGDYGLSDICVLYRKNSEYSPQGQKVMEALGRAGIKYTATHTNKERNVSLLEQVNNLSFIYEDEPVQDIISKLIKKNEDEKLISFVRDAMKQGAKDTDDLIDYVVESSDTVEDLQEENENQDVIVKTVHDAKGLEYPVVFILYLGDRQFPHSSRPDIEEESRLFYVGLTRAKDQLYILGQKGILQQSFMEQCLQSDVIYEQYHSAKSEIRDKQFKDKEKDVIDKTGKQLENEEARQKEELRKLMDFF